MYQKEAVFWRCLNSPLADRGWPLLDGGTFEEE